MSATERIRVLIVDDQALIRTGIATLLNRKADIVVVGQAHNGAEALAQVAALDPDVVLMDLQMPVLDGVAATQHLSVRGPRPAVIVLTTFRDDEHIFQALEAGARGYLLKDVDHRALAEAIRTVAAGGAMLHPEVTARVLPRLRTAAPPSAYSRTAIRTARPADGTGASDPEQARSWPYQPRDQH